MPIEDLAFESELRQKKAFEKFLSEPLTKMAISVIPEGQVQDGLKALLQAAFISGYNCGGGEVVENLLKKVLNHPERRNDSD